VHRVAHAHCSVYSTGFVFTLSVLLLLLLLYNEVSQLRVSVATQVLLVLLCNYEHYDLCMYIS